MFRQPLATAALTAVLVTIGTSSPTHAQDSDASKAVITPLKVTVTISRFQGEKRISQLPYTLSINLDSTARIQNTIGTGYASRRIGTKVPVTSTTTPQGGGSPVNTVTYQDVGTFIDCRVFLPDQAGRYRLDITIDESSVYEAPSARSGVVVGRPTLRSFRSSEALLVRNGQSVEVSSTPDRLTGEVVKVEVALEVIK